MANKNVTITKPTADRVRQVRITYSDGQPVRVDVDCDVETDNADVSYNGNSSDSDMSVYARADLDKMADIAKAAVARVVVARGF